MSIMGGYFLISNCHHLLSPAYSLSHLRGDCTFLRIECLPTSIGEVTGLNSGHIYIDVFVLFLEILDC